MSTTAESKKAEVPIGNLVDDDKSAISFAEDLLAASMQHVSTKGGIEWKEIAKVEKVPIEVTVANVTGHRGPLQDPSNSNPLVRASIPLYGISVEEMYKFLISKEGYMFIDPDADPDDFGRALMGPYEWKERSEGSNISVEYSSLKMPCPLSNRDYVVLNAFDKTSRSFLSASCYSPSVSKTASPYDEAPQSSAGCCSGPVRVAFYGAYSVGEAEAAQSSEEECCVLKVVQYVDINGWTMSSLNKHANVFWFKTFIKRAQERYPSKKENQE
uniref:START domain-containing protein n=1 Tax=Helicotheca tamesis TaxID=374047 RepID=A0A7S2GV07_9STRA